MSTPTKTVRNVSGETLTVPDIGVVEAGATIAVPADFHNANFETVLEKEAPKGDPITKSDKK